MLTSLNSVDRNFYALFLGPDLDTPSLTLPTHTGNSVTYDIKYAKKSAEDFVETDDEDYPRISILNETPKLKDGYYFPYQKRFADLRDTDNNGLNDLITEFPDPIPFVFKYQISCACKSESHWDAIKLHFFRTFGFDKQSSFTFNKKSLPLNDSSGWTLDVGDFVGYTWSSFDPFRSDGVSETVFTFELTVWLHIKDPKDYEVLESLVINVNVQQNG